MKKLKSILLVFVMLLSATNVFAEDEICNAENEIITDEISFQNSENLQEIVNVTENEGNLVNENITEFEELNNEEKNETIKDTEIAAENVIKDIIENTTENIIEESTNETFTDNIVQDITIEISTENITEDTYTNNYLGGCLHTPKEISDNFQKVPELSSKVRSTLPSKADISKYFPSVGNQGNQNSCVGWATAYYLKTAHEQMERNWGVSSNSHIFSPSYVYNQINNGSDNGAYIFSALDLLKEQGVCTISSMPYNTYNYTTKPNSSQIAEANEYKIYDYSYISANDSNKVDKIKNEINQNNPAIIGVEIYPDLDNLGSSNKIYDSISGNSRGGHALCLIGYDDSLNAFKFINSWGNRWGISGFGYISYSLIENSAVTYDIYIVYDLINNQRMELNKSVLNMEKNEKFSLTASVTPATPGVQSYTWKSSNTSVATVDNLGVVEAKSKGNATITVSEKISGKSAACSVTVYNEITVGSIETEINPLANDSFKVYIRDVKYSDGSSLDNVLFPTWTENNGQDDLIWHKGSKVQGTNDWVVTIKTSEHKNEVGKYITHAYTQRNGQNKILKGIGYTIQNNILYDEVVKENSPVYGSKYKIIIKNVRYSTGLSPNKVIFPTWTINNGQDDMIWHEGRKISGTNNWEIVINIADHNEETGEYRTHIYAENNDGRKYICQVNANVIGITSSGITSENLSNDEIKICIKNVVYSDNTIPYKVMFPTWTEKNGQDDLVWHEGTRVSGTNDWVMIIKRSAHKNEAGNYITQIYARPNGNEAGDRMLGSIGYVFPKSTVGWTCISSYNNSLSEGDVINDAGSINLAATNAKTDSVTLESNFEVKSGDKLSLDLYSYFTGNEEYFDQAASVSWANVTAENGDVLLSIRYELTGYMTSYGTYKNSTVTDETAGKITLNAGLESTGTRGVNVALDYICLEVNGSEK
ncbi:MAG: GBS Bsp-like repeat-containing protein [Clostridia bacterium]|nr:GBS Bsp-like repeat-containing protein [Clostridia bacterium]